MNLEQTVEFIQLAHANQKINLSDSCVSYFVSYCKENKILFKSK